MFVQLATCVVFSLPMYHYPCTIKFINISPWGKHFIVIPQSTSIQLENDLTDIMCTSIIKIY